MKTIAFAAALAMSSAAFAQTATDMETTASDTDMVAATEYDAGAAMAGSHIVQPSNASPERDMRGIAVISAPAMVPAGWNNMPASGMAMGGPLLDPETGAEVSETASYPACTATVTDNCVQSYERGRR